ncbi:sulfotransferase domain-containing protein [Zooshikella harenae]|uniref:Sulfotransferase domain-containing protein n=1 Tax=Zooshikella harenae TaxID=2827238 RepID=A0ABS5ZIG1_9GAMM|nr:sulfotransferase domain-containing protein [Zooshikella harenae]MBU2713856.1 sulfotransferase domain-containing protein [Zooshikella harenae]
MPLQPRVLHSYHNHLLDSSRWEFYTPKDDDIIVCSSYKSGSIWLQYILKNLVNYHQNNNLKSPLFLSWIDYRGNAPDSLKNYLAKPERRVLKSHLPLDGIPYFPQVKYIVLARDPRDVCLSLWDYYTTISPSFLQLINESIPSTYQPLPSPPASLSTFWQQWLTKGAFPWQHEGYPFWGNMYHTQSWWNYRHLENILFVHYNDLLANLAQEINVLARFIDTDLKKVAHVAQRCTFSVMKKNARFIIPEAEHIFANGAESLINKGRNGRWLGRLSEDDLALVEIATVANLNQECGLWIEKGRAALTPQQHRKPRVPVT